MLIATSILFQLLAILNMWARFCERIKIIASISLGGEKIAWAEIRQRSLGDTAAQNLLGPAAVHQVLPASLTPPPET